MIPLIVAKLLVATTLLAATTSPVSACFCKWNTTEANHTKTIVNTLSHLYLNLGSAKDENATKGEFPYQLSLAVDNVHACGAAIIGDSWAITTANCVTDPIDYFPSFAPVPPNRMGVKAGHLSLTNFNLTGDEAEYKILEVVIHPSYMADTVDPYDIALIRIEGTFKENNSTKKIPIATAPQNGEAAPSYTLTGWTLANPRPSNVLQKTEIGMIPQDTCKALSWFIFFLPSYSKQTMMCGVNLDTSSQGLCILEGGAPVTQDGKLVALTTATDCFFPMFNYFTNVSAFAPWIEDVTNGSKVPCDDFY